MKNRLIVMFTAFLVSMLPLGAVAAEHQGHDHSSHAGMEHGSMNHDGMDMKGNMIMLGEQEVDGVEAMVHLKDVKDAMSKMGMEHTHHFMVMFTDTAKGESIDQGAVAVKITDPAGKTSEPLALMGMQGHFGADVALGTPGDYQFMVGTKLADGKKRQFEFKYTVK